MTTTTVSVRGQTVIPREIRRASKIEPKSKLEWEIRDGEIVVHPLPPDPVGASRGLFRGRGLGNEELLAERRGERFRDRQGHG